MRPDELEDSLVVEEVGESEAKPEDIELPFAMPPVNPIVGKPLVGAEIERAVDAGTVVAIDTE